MQQREVTPTCYQKFCTFLKAESGIILGDAKQYLVRSRLTPLMNKFEINDINTLIDKVISKVDASLTYLSIEAMTTNETLWFRDRYPFDILTDVLLPQLSKQQSSVKIWSAACSSGQEPYSIAMTYLQFKQKNPHAFPKGIKIVGTDLSKEMIATCSAAVYDDLSLNRGLSKELQQRFFISSGDKACSLIPQVRELVTFKQLNLTHNFNGMGKFDIVFCRNVLIYFDTEAKTRILQNISACLPTNGSLILGASESLAGAQSHYKMITRPTGLYYSKV